LQEVAEEIKELGGTLIAISPERKEFSKQMAKKHDLTFDILWDEGNHLAEKFGIKFVFPGYLQEVYKGFGSDLQRYNGDDSWTLPMPARYVVNQDSKIVSANVHPDYTKRPEPSKTVEDLKKISKPV
jgi:peroxiredoxin